MYYMWEDGGFRGLEKTKYFLGCFGFFKKIKILKKRGYISMNRSNHLVLGPVGVIVVVWVVHVLD